MKSIFTIVKNPLMKYILMLEWITPRRSKIYLIEDSALSKMKIRFCTEYTLLILFHSLINVSLNISKSFNSRMQLSAEKLTIVPCLLITECTYSCICFKVLKLQNQYFCYYIENDRLGCIHPLLTNSIPDFIHRS